MILLWCADIFNVAVEVWLAYWLFDVPKHRRFHQPWVRVLEYLGFLGIPGGFIIYDRMLGMRFSNVQIIFLVIFFFLSALIFTARNIFCCMAWAGIYYGTISLLELPGIVLSGWITGQPYVYCAQQFVIYNYLYIVFLSICLIIIYKCWGLSIRGHIENTISSKINLLWIIFAFIEWWVITYFLIIGHQEYGRDIFLYNLVSILCIVLLILVFACFIIYRQSESLRQQRLIQDARMETEYMKIKNEYLKKSIELHDLKHQLQTLGAYLSTDQNDDAKRFLEDMVGDLQFSQGRIHAWTGNPLIDSLLDGKMKKAVASKINMEIQSSNIRCAITDKDMSILLGNLLDNAIEGASKALKNKEITVQIVNKGNMLFIRVRNSLAQPPIIKDGKIVTSKADKVNHGWGIKSIETIVEKYGGQLDITYDTEYFNTQIIFWEQSEVMSHGERD